MPIPSWNVIADSEIDPESPLTSSLMFRLRDNVLALLGVDPADPAPAFTIPASYMHPDTAASMGCGTSSQNSTSTGAEVIVAHINSSLETVEVIHALLDNQATVGANPPYEAQISGLMIRPIWSSGTCTGIRIAAGVLTEVAGNSINPEGLDNTAAEVTITLADSWQEVQTLDRAGLEDCFIEAKARADSDYVYLQFRCRTVSNLTVVLVRVRLVVARTEFKSKAAP